MIAAALIGLAGAAACGAAEPKSQAGLKAAEADWVAALEHRDVRRLGCRLHGAFGDTNWQGRLHDRETILRALPNRPPSTLHLGCLDVRVERDFGIVRGLNTQKDGKGALIGTVRFTDLFVYLDGRWQAFSAQETPTASPSCPGPDAGARRSRRR
ncbi:MAG TPA: nuclear transport factor 2 family protein [Allosphingosinicella sp.]|nr:nuclear transport factor 2 family protein [Allosphingosinicella sp.]